MICAVNYAAFCFPLLPPVYFYAENCAASFKPSYTGSPQKNPLASLSLQGRLGVPFVFFFLKAFPCEPTGSQKIRADPSVSPKRIRFADRGRGARSHRRPPDSAADGDICPVTDPPVSFLGLKGLSFFQGVGLKGSRRFCGGHSFSEGRLFVSRPRWKKAPFWGVGLLGKVETSGKRRVRPGPNPDFDDTQTQSSISDPAPMAALGFLGEQRLWRQVGYTSAKFESVDVDQIPLGDDPIFIMFNWFSVQMDHEEGFEQLPWQNIMPLRWPLVPHFACPTPLSESFQREAQRQSCSFFLRGHQLSNTHTHMRTHPLFSFFLLFSSLF